MARKKQTKPPLGAAPAFTSRPFAALKGALLAAPQQPARPSEPPPATRPTSDAAPDDLFLRAMAGVRPLDAPSPGRAAGTRQQPATKPAQTPQEPLLPARRDELVGRKTFLQAVDKLQLDVRFEDRLPDDGELRPLSGNRLRQVRRGVIRLDRQLDLHGLTRDEALAALPRFLAAARQAGERGVLVITGQGLHSPEGPVLQQAVAGWLRDQGREWILEYAPAPRELGGSGALVLFVRPLDKPVNE